MINWRYAHHAFFENEEGRFFSKAYVLQLQAMHGVAVDCSCEQYGN